MACPSRKTIKEIYKKLYHRFGPQYWWPGRTRFEVIVGAVLTQNTNWVNVEKAIKNLRRKNLLDLRSIQEIPAKKLAAHIKPSGYFNIKAKRLKNLIGFISKEYDGSLQKMMREPLIKLRAKLLTVNGIGPETADSILLYALDKPTFVVDAYTKRVLYRHNIIEKDSDYHDVQEIFMKNLKPDLKVFNEYHALFVRLCKEFCKSTPVCDECPLRYISPIRQ